VVPGSTPFLSVGDSVRFFKITYFYWLLVLEIVFHNFNDPPEISQHQKTLLNRASLQKPLSLLKTPVF
jgi:hypothetical protein